MTDKPIILWRSGGNTVSTDKVRTRRLTVSLDDIDVVEVRRPLFIGASIFAVASSALALRFWDVLEPAEFVTLSGAGGIALLAGLIVARVQLHSLSIQGIAITLPVWTAHAMRNAIDDAIALRGENRDSNRKRFVP